MPWVRTASCSGSIPPCPVAIDRKAFVAMPFGEKPYPDRNWRLFEADLSYQRVMLPALIDGGYRPIRADTDALLEIIDHTMLREINGAEVMLVDLAMLNANVMWELGLRHAWRRSGTVLLAPEWVKHPFDVRRVPICHIAAALGGSAMQTPSRRSRMLQEVLARRPGEASRQSGVRERERAGRRGATRAAARARVPAPAISWSSSRSPAISAMWTSCWTSPSGSAAQAS